MQCKSLHSFLQDVALCVGAWDTVNPAAAEDEDCPVYGMPMCR